MLSKLRSATEILREDGTRTLLHKSGEYFKRSFREGYLKIRNRYRLSTSGVTATFDAPDAETVRTEKWRVSVEKEMLADAVEELKPSDVFYDIGAHIGLYTCFASQVCSAGTVVAFEPHAPNVRQLEKNISLNKPERATIINKAVSNQEGEVAFSQPDKESTESFHSAGSIQTKKEGSLTVDMVVGDSIIERKGLPQPTVVKIDTEGAESLVIDGMRNSLTNEDCRVVYCEVHPGKHIALDDGDEVDAVTDIKHELQKLGFKIESSEERQGQVHLKAVRPPTN
ncbi:MAG: FkbM family methyltransferase [Halobacteriales archaeon]|nr:FkbM family methyltransferase [Halobacteriales archaeon]